MQVKGGATGPMLRLARQRLVALSPEAKRRQRWFDWHEHHGRNVSRTCRHFSISRQTFYRWLRRYNPRDLRTLEDRPSRPQRCRQPSWTTAEVVAVRSLREQNRTCREEFYDLSTATPTVAGFTRALRRWEDHYNHIRPHQALGYRTPADAVAAWHHSTQEELSLPRESDRGRGIDGMITGAW